MLREQPDARRAAANHARERAERMRAELAAAGTQEDDDPPTEDDDPPNPDDDPPTPCTDTNVGNCARGSKGAKRAAGGKGAAGAAPAPPLACTDWGVPPCLAGEVPKGQAAPEAAEEEGEAEGEEEGYPGSMEERHAHQLHENSGPLRAHGRPRAACALVS